MSVSIQRIDRRKEKEATYCHIKGDVKIKTQKNSRKTVRKKRGKKIQMERSEQSLECVGCKVVMMTCATRIKTVDSQAGRAC